MAQARRRFARATLEMEGQRNRTSKSAFLFEQGLIATAEHEDALGQLGIMIGIASVMDCHETNDAAVNAVA